MLLYVLITLCKIVRNHAYFHLCTQAFTISRMEMDIIVSYLNKYITCLSLPLPEVPADCPSPIVLVLVLVSIWAVYIPVQNLERVFYLAKLNKGKGRVSLWKSPKTQVPLDGSHFDKYDVM